MTHYTATYSPDDNKIRLSASSRLDPETYARVKAAGFAWAPKQEQFIAPMWTPARADLAIELAGEIEDDDGSLIERAEDRAERFGEYKDKRASEAARAAEHVRQIADGIPLGQPILVGHHSERHARKDAERIESGMRKAVQLFDTAEYWKRRAAAAIAHAKYKERADVRHRRIKGIEADARKVAKNIENAEQNARVWAKVPRFEWDQQTAIALHIAGRSSGSFGCSLYSDLSAGRMHGDTAWRRAVASAEAYINGDARRWLEHYQNRLAYERAMLDESGGILAAGLDLQPGGTITHRGRRSVILRVNRKDGTAVSVSVTGQGWTVGIEEITSYEAPSEAAAEAVKVVTTKAPLVNYESADCARMTSAEWASIYADNKGTISIKATETHAAHRRRYVPGYLGTKYGAPRGEAWGRTFVYLTDAKTTEAPPLNPPPKAPRKSMARKIAEAAGVDTSDTPDLAAEPAPAGCALTEAKTQARAVLGELTEQAPRVPLATQSAPVPGDARSEIDAMRASLKAGVQVVSAPQLFPTPPDLAARMVELADITHGARILEPSAGTGRIVDAIAAAVPLDRVTLDCIEIHRGLADQLRTRHPLAIVRPFDFLQFVPNAAHLADVVLMNPPFANGADVDHVTHAVRFLAPGGRLVAIMSAGVNFREDRKTREFRALVERMDGYIEPLPADTFASSGTGVNTVLVVLEAPPAGHATRETEDTEPVAIAAPTAAEATADPGTVDEIVRNQMRRRVEWASDLGPLPIDIQREARGLDECAAQMQPGDQTRSNYRAAAVRLRAIAESPELISAAVANVTSEA